MLRISPIVNINSSAYQQKNQKKKKKKDKKKESAAEPFAVIYEKEKSKY